MSVAKEIKAENYLDGQIWNRDEDAETGLIIGVELGRLEQIPYNPNSPQTRYGNRYALFTASRPINGLLTLKIKVEVDRIGGPYAGYGSSFSNLALPWNGRTIEVPFAREGTIIEVSSGGGGTTEYDSSDVTTYTLLDGTGYQVNRNKYTVTATLSGHYVDGQT